MRNGSEATAASGVAAKRIAVRSARWLADSSMLQPPLSPHPSSFSSSVPALLSPLCCSTVVADVWICWRRVAGSARSKNAEQRSKRLTGVSVQFASRHALPPHSITCGVRNKQWGQTISLHSPSPLFLSFHAVALPPSARPLLSAAPRSAASSPTGLTMSLQLGAQTLGGLKLAAELIELPTLVAAAVQTALTGASDAKPPGQSTTMRLQTTAACLLNSLRRAQQLPPPVHSIHLCVLAALCSWQCPSPPSPPSPPC